MAIFQGEQNLFEMELPLAEDENYLDLMEQETVRVKAILNQIQLIGLNLTSLDAVCGRGGLLKPISGGTYKITKAMLHDLYKGENGMHVSNLGAIIAFRIASNLNIPSFIVDPVVVDEMQPVAKMTGLPNIQRKSIFHALNQKSVAREIAKQLNKSYENTSMVVAHMGGGVTVGAHYLGKVIDVNNGFDGDGPFSLERAGTIPNNELIELCFMNSFTKEEIQNKITFFGGLKAYTEANKVDDVLELLDRNKEEVAPIINALAYQIAKEIGAMGTVLMGKVDAVVLTGDLAKIPLLNEKIMERIHWIADVYVIPGENVMLALAKGTLRAMKGKEQIKNY